ncbi:MAG: type II toxin-antitoxin system YafQ family toxin [Candidatus Pacebacteria bacterium]|nr:type II toxin-antitoxin system YafQ family toxin [Candidatus Paceibacterota bacterium]MBP9866980.1 type II toxin-antitoxin system YafQ family toxin [Candidatus Paceibacterota bacterium]
MYSLLLSNKCKKSLLKISKHKKFKKVIFDEVVGKLLTGEKLPRQYKEHKLSGEHEGCMECHIQNDILLIYYFDNRKCILVGVDIGTHSELFE